MELICVDPARVADFWPHVKDKLFRAVERTRASDWEDDVDRIMSGRALVWLAWTGSRIDGVATTEIVKFNGVKFCYVTACGGEFGDENWLYLIKGIEEFAKKEGCIATRLLGRRGFRGLLPDYKEHLVLLEKELS